MAHKRWDETLASEVLRGAQRRLHRGWTSGHQGRTHQGDPVPPEHPEAASWCAFGAIRAECMARFPERPWEGHLLAEATARYVGSALRQRGAPILKQSAPRTLMEWNDCPARSQDEVLAIYEQTLLALTQPQHR